MPTLPSISAKPYYPFPTRILIDLYNVGDLPNVAQLEIEPVYGYVSRIVYHDGSLRMIRGANLDENHQGAAEIAKDKGYTKFFLQKLGYNTPRGKVFLLPHYVQTLTPYLSRHGFDAFAHIREIEGYVNTEVGYPFFIKPNNASQGKGVHRCENLDDLYIALRQYQDERVEAVLVEEAMMLPDYRVIVYDAEVVACYRREPLQVLGDGQNTIQTLLEEKAQVFANQGRGALIDLGDARLHRKLQAIAMDFESIPANGAVILLSDLANLSAGGSLIDYTQVIHPEWARFCVKVVQQMGLRLCGLDLVCVDITQPNSDYSILELNASPGLDNYAATTPQHLQHVRDLYQRIFNKPMRR